MNTASANPFGAADPALGYLYQCRYALWLLLKRSRLDESTEVSIERLDDIAFDTGTAQERLQTKHSVRRLGSLSNASSDLWKTVRVWSEGVLSGTIILPGAILCLVTTAQSPIDGIATYLHPEGYASQTRNEAKALRLMEGVTSITRTNQADVIASHAAFLRLSPAQRLDLLKSIVILDGQPNILDLETKIREELRTNTFREHLDGMVRGVEGWWFQTVVRHLANVIDHDTIRATDLLDQIQEIRDTQRRNALPLNFCFADMPEPIDPRGDSRTFVKQLRVVDCNLNTISIAICDHYKASAERSQWIRERLLLIDLWDRYSLSLIDEWQRYFENMREDLGNTPTDAEERLKGRNLYRIIQDKQIHIQPNCTHPTVMRGAYQMLADGRKLGWHPRWEEIIPSDEVSGHGE